MPKPLRSGTPIPIEVTDELWILEDGDGYFLVRPCVIVQGTGKGAPGLVKNVKKVIAPGTQISVVLP